jgi:hypothetical protein
MKVNFRFQSPSRFFPKGISGLIQNPHFLLNMRPNRIPAFLPVLPFRSQSVLDSKSSVTQIDGSWGRYLNGLERIYSGASLACPAITQHNPNSTCP